MTNNYEKYLIRHVDGLFINLANHAGDKNLEVELWEDIGEADLFSKETAEDHLKHIVDGKGFWTYIVDEDLNVNNLRIEKVVLTI